MSSRCQQSSQVCRLSPLALPCIETLPWFPIISSPSWTAPSSCTASRVRHGQFGIRTASHIDTVESCSQPWLWPVTPSMCCLSSSWHFSGFCWSRQSICFILNLDNTAPTCIYSDPYLRYTADSDWSIPRQVLKRCVLTDHQRRPASSSPMFLSLLFLPFCAKALPWW